MKTFIYTLLATLIFSTNGLSQTSLAGKVTDIETGEPILFGSVALYKGGNLETGVETDLDGFYNFTNIDPGTYDLEVSYLGYKSSRINGMIVYGGQANKLDIKLESGSTDDIIVKDYDVPLIKQDETTANHTLTSEQLKKLLTRNITAIRASTAKCFPTNQIEVKKEYQLTEKLPSRELNNTIQNLLDLQVRQVDY